MAKIYLAKDVYYNEENSCVYKNNVTIPIKGNNKKLLAYLIDKGTPVSKQELIDALWEGHLSEATVRQNIKRLRDTLNDTDFEIIQEKNGCYFVTKSTSFSPEILLPEKLTNSFSMNVTSKKIIGRKNVRKDLCDILKQQGNQSILLHGFGGVGKTSVARLIFSWVQNDYDCLGWVDYQGNLIDSMLSCLDTKDYMETAMDNAKREEKWRHIARIFRNNSQKKLFIIDNVDTDAKNNQDPLTDMALKEITAWKNTDIIITSRFSGIEPYCPYEIENLGNKNNLSPCMDLFYLNNPTAKENASTNDEIVKKLITLASYNSLVIELMAKTSNLHYEDLNEYYIELNGKKFAFPEMSVETSHDKYQMRTATQQLMKLYDPDRRNFVEQNILWCFHLLPEGEKISRKELTEWLGYKPGEIDLLIKEGWISFTDGLYHMHPLIHQTMQAMEEGLANRQQNDSFLLQNGRNFLLKQLQEQTLFTTEDSHQTILRKLNFADHLSCAGLALDDESALYLADTARENSLRILSLKYYKLVYERHKQEIIYSDYGDQEKLILYWRCTYYYGYVLSYTQKDMELAEELIAQSLDIASYIFEDIPYSQTRSLCHLGYIYSFNPDKCDLALQQFELAIDSARQELKELEDLEIDPSTSDYHLYAWCIDDYGSFCAMNYDRLFQTHRPEDFTEIMELAQVRLREALQIRNDLSWLAGKPNSDEVAWTCVNLARLLGKVDKHLDEAESLLQRAIGIYGHLDRYTPLLHNGSWARALVVYAQILENNLGKYAEAMDKYAEALERNNTLEEESPGAYSKEIADIRNAMEVLEKKMENTGITL